jgi:hypothetical protein
MVTPIHHPSQICDENHKFVTGLARFSVFCVEFSDNFCATQTQKEFWDRSIMYVLLVPRNVLGEIILVEYTPEKSDTPLCSPSFFTFFFITPFFDHWEKWSYWS